MHEEPLKRRKWSGYFVISFNLSKLQLITKVSQNNVSFIYIGHRSPTLFAYVFMNYLKSLRWLAMHCSDSREDSLPQIHFNSIPFLSNEAHFQEHLAHKGMVQTHITYNKPFMCLIRFALCAGPHPFLNISNQVILWDSCSWRTVDIQKLWDPEIWIKA